MEWEAGCDRARWHGGSRLFWWHCCWPLWFDEMGHRTEIRCKYVDIVRENSTTILANTCCDAAVGTSSVEVADGYCIIVQTRDDFLLPPRYSCWTTHFPTTILADTCCNAAVGTSSVEIAVGYCMIVRTRDASLLPPRYSCSPTHFPIKDVIVPS